MSATTENLVEQIKRIEERLADPTLDPNIRVVMDREIKKLRLALTNAAGALNEGKQVLKG